MRTTRLAVASLVAMGAMLLALLPPLQALVALRASLARGSKSFAATGPPGLEALAPSAGAPLAARADAQGSLRRLYFPHLALSGGAVERARQLLAAEATRFGLEAAPPQLELVAVRRTPSGTHVRLQQTSGGIPVWGAEAVVSFDAGLAPRSVACDLEPLPSGLPDPAAALTPAAACLRAAQAMHGVQLLHAPPTTALTYRVRDGAWRLEYRVGFACGDPAGDWDVWLDAISGNVREVNDRTVFDRTAPRAAGFDGSGRVFLPDPCLATGDPALQDGGDSDAAVPEAAYALVPLRDLEPPRAGAYRLAGPWVVLEDWEAPLAAPDSSATATFLRHRSDSGFEDVMVYYHLDTMQRWFQQLGFQDANARRQVADAHGLQGQDNSKFVPSLHRLSYGEGGVDDAEDAAVVVHEYGHATQFDIVPTWGTGGHAGALGEGFGDYLANAYAWSLFPGRVEAWNGVFQWDGHNTAWPGRRVVDTSLHYPENAGGEVHRAGTLWCSALTDALYALQDRTVLDRLVLDSMYSLTGAPLMEDWANAILAADVTLYRGAHVAVLVEVFGRWGLVDAASWRPVAIEHTPLDIRAAAAGAPRLQARIVSTTSPIDPASVVARVRTAGAPWQIYPLAALGDDVYAATLVLPPGGDLDLDYSLEARDIAGDAARSPAAPDACFHIAIGSIAECFETDSGWFGGVPGDDAYAGKWVRAVPVGTSAQPAADHTFAGSACFVTGNAAAAAPASEADVDGGTTTLLSPVYDLRGATRARLSYWRWFTNDQGTAPDEDPWTVEASNDGGTSWVTLERTLVSEAAWRRLEFDLVALLGPPGRVRLRFVARDAGVGSLVEAAVDDVLLQVRTTTDVSTSVVPAILALLPNAPNPCNPSTTLRFTLDRPGTVRLAIYDAGGRLVRPLLATALAPGLHVVAWDGHDRAGLQVPSGIYFTRLATEHGQVSRKLTVLR